MASGAGAVTPFRIDVPDELLQDLTERLARARWPEPMPRGGIEDVERLRRIGRLLSTWRDDFDWRSVERSLNRHPQLRVTVDGVGLHVVHARGSGADPMPLLLVNGWPSTFAEYVDALPLLTDPGSHGADPSDAFDVVIATRPGYGFSDPAYDRLPDERADAALLGGLMETLGYRRFVAHGDDFGGTLLSVLALEAPDRVTALHVAEWLESPSRESLTLPEREYLDALGAWRRDERGYGHVQANRPETLALALDDTPLGLLAWITDKLISWSPAAPEEALDRLILTTTAIYWFTHSIGTSMRPYAVGHVRLGPGERVEVPTGAVAPLEARPAPPREWLERTYADLRSYEPLPRGGHFWAAEDPPAFASRLREFFRPFRTGSRPLA
nr:haloalkane dehalogenase [uncultured bacterium]